MSTRSWSVAEKARTLIEAHAALVALRPFPEADRSVWVSYYLGSAAVYRQVADVDHGHRGHAMYWADREKAKADLLSGQADTSTSGGPTSRRSKRCKSSGAGGGDGTVAASTLEDAHEALSKLCPSTDAGRAAWLAYHQRAATVYADVAEVDRAHHHEALFYMGLERRRAAALSTRVEKGAEEVASVDCTCH